MVCGGKLVELRRQKEKMDRGGSGAGGLSDASPRRANSSWFRILTELFQPIRPLGDRALLWEIPPPVAILASTTAPTSAPASARGARNTQLSPSRLQKSQIPKFLYRSEIPTIFEDFCMGCSIVVKKFQNHIYISEKKNRNEK